METLEEKVLKHGESMPNKLALGYRNERLTFGELRCKILCMANYLHKQGVGKKDIVLLQAATGFDFVSAYMALHCLGATVTPLDRKAAKDTVGHIRRLLDAEYIIGTEQFLIENGTGFSYEQIKQEKEMLLYSSGNYNASEQYDILFTTGTTGEAKGIIVTGASVLAAIRNEIKGSGMTEEEILLIPIPLNHSFGIGKLRAALYLGASVVLQNGVSMIADLRNNIERFGCTAMICVPSALQIIVKQADGQIAKVLGKMHFIEVASAPFGLDLKEKMIKELPDVHILNRYGSTETPAAIYLDMKDAPDKLASIGKAVDGVKVKIVDENKEELMSSAQNIGKIAISGAMLMKGYYHDETATSSVLVDGWMYTKDIGYMDMEGYIYLMGRDDDIINTGGKKFSPLEVEELLMKSSMVKECVVVGIEDPDKILGNIPVLVYVPATENFDDAAIISYLAQHIEKYKLPVRCVRLKSLPRNYMGKVERKKIRELF